VDVKVRFRFNKATGEVEVFEVEDQGVMHLSEAEHNSLHDRIAADVGRVIERNPHVIEVLPGSRADLMKETDKTPEKVEDTESQEKMQVRKA